VNVTATPPARQLEIAERQARVLDLVRQGYTYRQISKAPDINVSIGQVHKDFHTAISEIVRPAAEEARRLALLRTTWAWRNAQEMVTEARRAGAPDRALRALDRALAALERLARLEGVDAPTRNEVMILSLDQVNAEISRLEQILGSGEMDIIDVEPLD
jgi:hypothetical protein